VKPLDSIRVCDLSRLVAGGVAGMLLADFGADVVKVEQPGSGDPLRTWTRDGVSYWWKVLARNKRVITLNLRSEEGLRLFKELIPKFDVLVESFVPGTLEAWGLGWDVLQTIHPGLILARISGWGQTGLKSGLPGFGSLVEAASGFAAMNGEAHGPPILPSFPLADMVTGLYASNAIMFALYMRDVQGGKGQVIDISLFESLFSLLGPLPAEYSSTGAVRLRQGNRSKNSSPRGVYSTRDGRWIAVSASTPKMAERFMVSYGLGDLLSDPRFASNEARVQHAEVLDQLVEEQIYHRTLEENQTIITDNQLTAVAVQTIQEIEQDEHWKMRNLIIDVLDSQLGQVRMHNAVPTLSETPGEVRWAGKELGADNYSFYVDEIGLHPDRVGKLQEEGVI
jgi:crotonobetainyl-CoA:carnitine CoA-transferase CaiB-like acyl-CoA transferase